MTAVRLFLIQVLNGVQYGLLLFLVASGLTLIFGIMGVINLAHGSFYMVGAYLAFALTRAAPATCALAIAAAASCSRSLFGFAARVGCSSASSIERDHLYQVLLTYGLILVFEELRSLLFGDDVHGVAVPQLSRLLDPARPTR